VAHPTDAQIAAVAQAVRTAQAQLNAAEAQTIAEWRLSIDRNEAAVTSIDYRAEQACDAIRSAIPLAPGEVVAICAALFHALQQEAHITRNRDAMACLCDIASDFAAAHEEEAADRAAEERSEHRRAA
jgi:urease accessory protein UreF